MNKFRRVNHGFVLATTSCDVVKTQFKVLGLIKDSIDEDLSPKNKAAVTTDVLEVSRELVGGRFKEFVEVNYGGGRSPLANLMKSVVQYLNGRVGFRNLLSLINIEENKLGIFLSDNRELPNPSLLKAGTPIPLLEGSDVLRNDDLFKLLEGIGPVNYARILLLLNGSVQHGHG